MFSTFNPFSSIKKTFERFNEGYQECLEDIKLRQLSINQYRDRMHKRVINIIEKFGKERMDESSLAIRDINSRLHKLQEVYNQSVVIFEQKQLDVKELNKIINSYSKLRKTYKLDESIESFTRFYNETIENMYTSHPITIDKFLNLDFDHINKPIINNWEHVLKITLESSKIAERKTKLLFNDFIKIQEDLIIKAKKYTDNSLEILNKQELMKIQLKNETKFLEKRLKNLEIEFKTSTLWLNI